MGEEASGGRGKGQRHEGERTRERCNLLPASLWVDCASPDCSRVLGVDGASVEFAERGSDPPDPDVPGGGRRTVQTQRGR